MKAEGQLAEWLKGNPIHNDKRDECCPDFSCCQPSLLVDQQARQAFVDAGEELRMSMLGMFLGNAMALAAAGKEVYIADDDDPEKKYATV